MKNMETGGRVKKLKGRLKESIGIVTGNRQLEREGSRQRAEGTVQAGLGKARRKAGECVARVAKAIKK